MTYNEKTHKSLIYNKFRCLEYYPRNIIVFKRNSISHCITMVYKELHLKLLKWHSWYKTILDNYPTQSCIKER